jgi:biopolymer transport protein ExbB/TolQ
MVGDMGWVPGGAAPSAGVILRLSPGLIVLYVLVIFVWYELLRALLVNQLARRRGGRERASLAHRARREEAVQRQREREGREREAAEEAEPDPERRRYYLARKARKTEQDAAIAAANEAAEQAVKRIERRYREIDEDLRARETARVKGTLRRPLSDKWP